MEGANLSEINSYHGILVDQSIMNSETLIDTKTFNAMDKSDINDNAIIIFNSRPMPYKTFKVEYLKQRMKKMQQDSGDFGKGDYDGDGEKIAEKIPLVDLASEVADVVKNKIHGNMSKLSDEEQKAMSLLIRSENESLRNGAIGLLLNYCANK